MGLFHIAAAALVTASLASAATAATIRIERFDASDFDASTSTAVENGTFTIGGDAPVERVGTVPGEWRSPFGADSDIPFFAIRQTPDENPGVLAVDGVGTSFSIAIGSIDATNAVVLERNGTEVARYDGSDFVSFGGQDARNRVITFTDVRFDTAILTTNTNTLEFAGLRTELAPVPLPAAGVMLLAGLGGLGALRRRRGA